MPLRDDALELVDVLKRVVTALENFRHPYGASYAADMARQLCPLVSDFELAVTQDHSRNDAKEVLSIIAPLMQNVNGAATKGELNIFPNGQGDTLEEYWRLRTIFQESIYADEKL